MAIQKRKAVAKSADTILGRVAKRGKKVAEPEIQDDNEEQEEAQEMATEEPEQPQLSEAEKEKEIVSARKKELKSTPVDQLKELMTSNGLETGKKEDMIESLVAHEAKVRADARAEEVKRRAVVVAKKDELEALQLPELKDLCSDVGIKGVLPKPVRVEQLLKHWLENDGVNKALAKQAYDARETDLAAMDKPTLLKICEAAGANAFVKEIVAERILKKEVTMGRFQKPKVEDDDAAEAPVEEKKAADMIDALMASDANRKKEEELKQQQEEEAAAKRKELKAKSVDELKKALKSKGVEPTGNKDAMVDALFEVGVQEAALAARTLKLKAMAHDDLKKLLARKGLDAPKTGMVAAVLAHEAKIREQCKAYEVKVSEVLVKIKEDMDSKTGADLKELCATRNLKLGLTKEDRIKVLLQDARDNGEVDKVITALAKDARTQELLAMDTAALKKLCEEMEVDPLVKEVMIERVLSREEEVGVTQLEPAKKRAKTSRK
eukprot:TRINITY_DN998_c0_g1_i2.p1 TRINITY_DN998_c0_g1~~TRINITY_DN998_c0_g1_i2.p1  ORF type:complete len:494 (-),score=218.69 TRINITY_DN998_c0_g1_i2:272-1753(-)